LGIFTLLSLVIFYGLSRKATNINQKIKSHPWTLYEVFEEKDETQRGITCEDDFKLRDSNVWSHTHRMYLIGKNSVKYPWFIPKDFPRDALKRQDKELLINFIDEYNEKLKWTILQKWAFVLIKIIYPPLAKTVHLYIRKNKFKALQKALYVQFPLIFWGD
jgi:hypothetical protein